MTRLISSAAAVLAVVLASCAPTTDTMGPGDSASAAPGRQCFITSQVRNFRHGGTNSLYIRADRNAVYELNTSGGCLDLDFARQMTITGDGAAMASNRLCTGDWARIYLPGSPAALSTCRARVERLLSEEEVANLPRSQRP